ncbi:MAG: hypothetical protein IJW30_00390 [Clostridia bacterium]|nr:hypothetical protein [Clostridia bacterium]
MQFKAKKRLGMGLCIPAVLFLFEPMLAFTDVLPNCIGYLLLCAAISQAADLNDRLSEALDRFKKMMWISVGAMLAQFYVNEILPTGSEAMNAYERPVLLLLCSFVLFILHCWILIPAYRDLFLGMNTLAERYGSEALLRENRRGENRSERMARAASRFAFWNALLAMLPELSVLTTFEFEKERLPFDWYRFIGLFRTVAGFASAIVSLIFLIRFLRYVNALLKDQAFMDALTASYGEEVLPNTFVLGMRRYRFAFAFLMIGAVFTVRLRIDGRLLLPAAFCGLFFAVGVWWISKRFLEHQWLMLSCGALALVSMLARWRGDAYLELYQDPEFSLYSLSAFRAYLGVRILSVLEILLTVLVVCLLLRALYSMVCVRVYVTYGDGTQALSERASARLHKKMKLRMIVTAAFFSLSAAANIVEVILGARYPWLWWITMLLSLASVIAWVSLLFAILDELEDRLSTDWLYKQQHSAHTVPVTPNIKKECSQNAEQSEQESAEQSE